MQFWRRFYFGAVLIYGLFGGALPSSAEECSSWYQRLGRSVVAAPGKAGRWVLHQQKEYWNDVWATRGGRLVRAPRQDPEKFHWLFFIEDPISETASAVKHGLLKKDPLKYRLSAPITMAAWGYGYTKLDENVADKQLMKVLSLEEKNPASPYLIQLWQMGVLEPEDMITIIKAHTKQINDFLEQKSGTSVERRIERLRKLGVLKSERDKAAFASFLRQALNDTLAKHDPDRAGSQFVTELHRTVRNNALKLFPEMSDKDRELLMFALLPEVKILNQNDLALAKKTLDSDLYFPIAKEFGLPYAMGVAGASDLNKKDEVERKKMRAEKIPEIARLPEERKRFLDRVDIPAFREEITVSDFKGSKEVLSDELERWRVFLSDRRFAYDAALWREGKVSDIEAMRAFEIMSRSYGAFYEETRAHSEAGPQQVCEIVHGGGKGELLAPLFARVEPILKNINAQVKFQGGQQEFCREEIVRLMWVFHVEVESSGGLTDAQSKSMDERLERTINDSCLTEKAKAFKSLCQ